MLEQAALGYAGYHGAKGVYHAGKSLSRKTGPEATVKYSRSAAKHLRKSRNGLVVAAIAGVALDHAAKEPVENKGRSQNKHPGAKTDA